MPFDNMFGILQQVGAGAEVTAASIDMCGIASKFQLLGDE